MNYFEMAAINRVDVKREEMDIAIRGAAASKDEQKQAEKLLDAVQRAYIAHASVQLFRIFVSQVVVWLVAGAGLFVAGENGFALAIDIFDHILGARPANP